MERIQGRLEKFLDKYPLTLAWRIKKHAKILETHVNPDEDVLYAFCGQKKLFGKNFLSYGTYCAVITTDRLLLASKNLFVGYQLISITPDMFNDLSVKSGLIWGSISIDTIKELVIFSYLQNKALPEIETAISQYMMKKKKEYKEVRTNKENNDHKEC